MWAVYMLTHRTSGRAYIGWTKHSVEAKWLDLRCGALRGLERPGFYALLREEGHEAFHIQELATGLSEPGYRRVAWDEIAKRKTYAPHGFNGRPGPVMRRVREKEDPDGLTRRK